MKKLIFVTIIGIVLMMNNVNAEETILIKSNSFDKTKNFSHLLIQTKCIDGYLLTIVRNNTFITTTQVYRQGLENDNYIPQPVACR